MDRTHNASYDENRNKNLLMVTFRSAYQTIHHGTAMYYTGIQAFTAAHHFHSNSIGTPIALKPISGGVPADSA